MPRFALRLAAAIIVGWLTLESAGGVRAEQPFEESYSGSSGLPSAQPVLPQATRRTIGKFSEVPETDAVSDWMARPRGNDAQIEVVLGQSRILTVKKPLFPADKPAAGQNAVSAIASGVIAIGDPTILDFEVLPNPQMIRLVGKRAGITDLTIISPDNEAISMQVVVLYDLDLLRVQLAKLFPHTIIGVSQVQDHVVLEGQARNTAQIAQIEAAVRVSLASSQAARKVKAKETGAAGGNDPRLGNMAPGRASLGDGDSAPVAAPEMGSPPETEVTYPEAQIINLMHIPGVQQIMLQVRVAELNRTGLREMGIDWLAAGSNFTAGTALTGTSIAAGLGGLLGNTGVGNASGSKTTAFAIFPSANVDFLIRALRQNNLLTILAEPNLVAMTGHEASFLAGGQFPVPVPQGVGGAGSGTVTVQWKDFGVQLNFLPHIIDGELIRLKVAPEVSTIDQNLGTTLVVGGSPVPGINTRRVETTVEMKEGQTLALAGLLTVTLDASTSRIPGMGDLPYIGAFFSNTTHQSIEKELLVLVTPVLVSPIPEGQEIPYPGQDIMQPNDKEFYFLSRIEGRTGRPYRSTTSWDNPLGLVERMKLERDCLHGSVGFSR